jgi:hypothetical protein
MAWIEERRLRRGGSGWSEGVQPRADSRALEQTPHVRAGKAKSDARERKAGDHRYLIDALVEAVTRSSTSVASRALAELCGESCTLTW